MFKKYLIGLRANPHTFPVLIVAVAAAMGQAATLIQRPLVSQPADTPGYIKIAHAALASPISLIDSFRTPGYPLFLAIIFKLTGGEHLAIVVAVQAVLTVLTVFECYVLAFRLTHRRWVACFIASAIGLNLYIINWERVILTEALSWCCLVTLFLCYERFIRRPGLAWGTIVALVSFVSIMIRPFNLFIPFLLLGLALLRAWWSHELRSYWKHTGIALLILSVCLISYMGLNAKVNGYFGVSWVTEANLMDKVIEYHMDNLPAPSQYAVVQAEAHDAVRAGQIYFNPPDKQDTPTWWGPRGSYASYVILHHPGTYLIDSVHDVLETWLEPALLYSQNTLAPVDWRRHSIKYIWENKLVDISTIELDTYLLLPLLLIGLGVWLWRHRQDKEHFLLLALGLMVLSSIVVDALLEFVEFYRIRSPVDWAMLLLGGIVLAEVLVSVAQRVSQPSLPLPAPAVSGKRKPDLEPLVPLGAGMPEEPVRAGAFHPLQVAEQGITEEDWEIPSKKDDG